ncbi:hypothetical protein EC915_107176 [Pseudomonas sp. LP_7_YM]|nr:hypothetical protein EC915_107176 [Pseudomonas sp. LP_7_YM]
MVIGQMQRHDPTAFGFAWTWHDDMAESGRTIKLCNARPAKERCRVQENSPSAKGQQPCRV